MRGLTRRGGARISRLRRQPPFAINERVDALPRFERYGGSDPLEKTMSSLDLDSLLSKKSLGLGPGVSGPHPANHRNPREGLERRRLTLAPDPAGRGPRRPPHQLPRPLLPPGHLWRPAGLGLVRWVVVFEAPFCLLWSTD